MNLDCIHSNQIFRVVLFAQDDAMRIICFLQLRLGLMAPFDCWLVYGI